MNLQGFLDHRTHCPFCGNELFTNYHCARRQTLRFEEDRMIFISRLDDYPYRISGVKYKIGYSFDPKGDGWCAEFYDGENKRLRQIPMHLIRKLMDKIDKSTYQPSCFIKQCTSRLCGMYACGTTDFDLDFKRPIITFDIQEEVFTLGQESESGLKTFVLRNRPMENATHLSCSVDPSASTKIYPGNTTTIKLPLIPFVSKEETLARLNKLIVFS